MSRGFGTFLGSHDRPDEGGRNFLRNLQMKIFNSDKLFLFEIWFHIWSTFARKFFLEEGVLLYNSCDFRIFFGSAPVLRHNNTCGWNV